MAEAKDSGNLHERLLNSIGTDIVTGDLEAGTVVRAEELRVRYEVSLSVVREVVREVERKPTRWEAFIQRFGTAAFWILCGAVACGAAYGALRLYRRRLPI